MIELFDASMRLTSRLMRARGKTSRARPAQSKTLDGVADESLLASADGDDGARRKNERRVEEEEVEEDEEEEADTAMEARVETEVAEEEDEVVIEAADADADEEVAREAGAAAGAVARSEMSEARR